MGSIHCSAWSEHNTLVKIKKMLPVILMIYLQEEQPVAEPPPLLETPGSSNATTRPSNANNEL